MEDIVMENKEAFAEGIVEVTPLTSEELLTLLEEKKYSEIRTRAEKMLPPDLAELFDGIPVGCYALFFSLLPKELAAETFVEMDADINESLINSFNDSQLADILDELYIDDTVDIIEEMPASVVKRILRNSKSEDRETINRILRYPKDSAGTLMTTEYVRFIGSMTVEMALSHIRKVAIDKETIYNCYVTDKNRRLLGLVTAKQLLLSELDVSLSEIMNENVIAVETHDDKEEVANKLDKYGLLAVPVVDRENRLVGIVTVDDAIDVIKEASEEDFAKMAAITPSETPYLKTGVFSLFKSRIPWLLILLISSTVSSAILTGFEAALPAVLVLFVPMIMGTGGNSGGQSSVTVTRSISLSEVEFSDLGRVFLKEMRVGILCGTVLGAVTFLKVYFIDGMLFGNEDVTLIVSLAVALSLSVTILVAKMIGAVLPIVAKKIGLDPAVMASPLITTLVDAVSLIVYFYVASAIISF